MKKYYELKQGHRWFGGYVKQTDVISCVDSGMWKWHILIVEELVEANETTQREREFLLWITQRWVSRWQVMAMA